MFTRSADFARGFTALRMALASALYPCPAVVCAGVTQTTHSRLTWLMSEALDYQQPGTSLEDRGVADALDEGYSPPEKPSVLPTVSASSTSLQM